jgi:hypothetical protein
MCGPLDTQKDVKTLVDILLNFRNDGSYTTKIRLPTTNPFYLLRYTDPCQLVEGMNVREESVFSDDENDSGSINSVSGSHPYGPVNGQTNYRLFYCYYWAM